MASHYTIIVPDVRGDYEALCRAIPGARLFIFGHFPVNLLQAPRRVPPNIYAGRFSQVFTDRFDLQQSSRRYIAMVLDDLYARCEAPGHWPCLPDLRDALQDRKEPRGSDELRFRNRCLARVDTLCRALGDESIGVEQGIDLDLCKIDHVDLVLFVAPTMKAVEAASSVIAERWQEEVPRRYVLTSATECLSEDFDWVGLLERSA